MSERVDIAPSTRIGALLEDWPELFETLIRQAPEFSRLRNPILRKTIGRVATLARAAKIAGLEPVALVNQLRIEAGLRPLAVEDDVEGAAEGTQSWPAGVQPKCTLDADALLDAGENPLAHVHRVLASLNEGEAMLLRSSFRPVPLVEALKKKGRVRVATRKSGEEYETIVLSE